MSIQTRDDLLMTVSSATLCDGIRKLFLASNELYGDRVVTDLEQRFQVGSIIQGAITWASIDGLKMSLEDGVQGIVPLEEITWWKQRPYAKDFAAIGETRNAMVLEVDVTRQRVVLSMRQSTSNPWEGGILDMYPPSRTVNGVVKTIKHYGAFISIEPGLDGLCPLVGMRDYHEEWVNHAGDVVGEGDRVKVRVVDCNLAERKLELELVDVVGGPAQPGSSSQERCDGDDVEMLGWSTPEWPWTSGENAIRDEKRKRRHRSAHRRNQRALRKRPLPSDWTLCWK